MEKIPPFLDFLLSNRILVSPCLDIRYSPARGYHILISSEARSTIKAGTPLVRIPKKSLLGPSSSVISNIIPDDQQCSLAGLTLAYQVERALAERSPWFPYICMLPNREGSCLTFWDQSEKEWLRGTDAWDILQAADADLEEMYHTIAVPFYERNKSTVCDLIGLGSSDWVTFSSREAFIEAASVVAARCFEIDMFHGLALCPVADLFNHWDREDVRFESLFEVCELCGSISSCEHVAQSLLDSIDTEQDGAEQEIGVSKDDEDCPDLDGHESDEDSDSSEDEDDDTCDIVAHRDISIPKNERYRTPREVYNSYGALSSAQLLVKYGFAIRKNRHDYISLEREMRALYREKGMAWHSEDMDVPTVNSEESAEDGASETSDDDVKMSESSDVEDNDSRAGAEEPELKIDIHGRINRYLWDRAIAYSCHMDSTVNSSPHYDILSRLNTNPKMGSHAIPSLVQDALKILLEIIQRRWNNYADGGITSSEYDFVISEEVSSIESTTSESRKRSALIILANEKEMLELARARCEKLLGLI